MPRLTLKHVQYILFSPFFNVRIYLNYVQHSLSLSVRIHRRDGQVPYITPLDPLRFLLRSAMVYANKTAIIHRHRSFTFWELSERIRALANVLLTKYHVRPGDRVAILCQNISAFIEAQYAIPAISGVTVPINTRLSAKEVEYLLEHSGATVLIIQTEFTDKLTDEVRALNYLKIIEVADSEDIHSDFYEKLLADESKNSRQLSWNDMPTCQDENQMLSINYTSGSTGRPKGVIVTYRGAYMMALGMVIQDKLTPDTKFLWTLPMFHCNGWSFPWAIVAVGGTQITLNKLDYTQVWQMLKNEGITHYNGAPTVNNEICNHTDAVRLDNPIHVLSGGSALSSTLIKQMTSLNLIPTQVYGLTETYGPAVLTYDYHTRRQYTEEEQYKLLARPGYNIITSDEIRVLDAETATDVEPNGMQIGEICFTGNVVMKGYYNNIEETKKIFRNGVLWTGDLAVRHPDGSIEIVDRSKDVIVSGGENISSIEVENVIVQLDAILECAIVSEPDDKWGERPVAYIVLKKDKSVDKQSIIEHCRRNLAGYKCPSKIVFTETLPRTSTGKVQKYLLRNALWKKYKKRIN
ncbi:hypothetical protein BDF20DRAFT_895906 [Mycotypha africana]|uniref:uncharacterized protein n=1 Tax=Mycotypha africana TaxID=64632 RepID=UPI0023014FAF|nr:uncharacterized protein BDF20DRAFT_895906 [Mycotypha africana]KAI8968355.1 hypothetical protein BDF20DRAFT_895906 [Mycotypha africana]